jgi:transposase
MTTPRPLLIADELDLSVLSVCAKGASELRRMHELNTELVQALHGIMDYAYTGAAVRDVDTTEQPQFVQAKAALEKAV